MEEIDLANLRRFAKVIVEELDPLLIGKPG